MSNSQSQNSNNFKRLKEKLSIKNSHPITLDANGNVSIGDIPGGSFYISEAPLWVIDCLKLLNGKHTLRYIYDQLPIERNSMSLDTFLQFIKQLQDNHLLTPQIFNTSLSNDELALYDRQMIYFNLIDKHNKHPTEYQEKIKQQKIVIFGVGGWGSWIAMLLAKTGIGHLVLVDGDDVELSNLNRCPLFHHRDVGKNKANVAKSAIDEINPYVKVTSIDSYVGQSKEVIEKILEDATYSIVAWSKSTYVASKRPEYTIHYVAKKLGLPMLEARGDAYSLSVGPLLNLSSSKLCFFCIQKELQKQQKSSNKAIELLRQARANSRDLQRRDINQWQVVWPISMMASLVCDAIIHAVLDVPHMLEHRAWTFDFKNYRSSEKSYTVGTCHHDITTMPNWID